MEPELTNVDVLNMYEQGMSTADIARDVAARAGRNYDALKSDLNASDLEIIQTIVPTYRPSITGEEARAPQPMTLDMRSLEERSGPEIAEYVATMMGRNYTALKDAGFDDDEIIETLVSEESVQRARPGLRPMLESLARNFVRSAPSAVAGLGAATLTAPAGPLASAGAGVAAGTAAAPYGTALEQAIFGEEIPVLPGERVQTEIGRSIGTGLPFVFAPHQAARQYSPQGLAFLARRSEQFKETPFDALVLAAATRPRTLLATETLAVGGAGLGAGEMESRFPGNETASLIGELAGGILTPGAALSELVGNSLQRIATGTSAGLVGRSERGLVRLVAELAKDYGEDPAEIANLIARARTDEDGIVALAERYGVDPGVLNTVALADSPVLRTLSATIENSAGRLGPTQARARRGELTRNIEAIGTMIELMRGSGDERLMTEAARIQDELFRTTLQANLDAKTLEAATAAGRLVQDDPNAISRAGREIARLTEQSLSEARRQERQIWGAVDRRIGAPLTNTLNVFDRLRTDLQPTRRLESFPLGKLRSTFRELSRQEGGPTVGDLLALKRNLFDQMQSARSGTNPNYADARRYGELYEAVMDDLASVSDGGRELEAANAFSRALNDVYSRAFPATALGRDARGGQRIPVELLGQRILSGGGDATDARLQQLDDAVNFVVQNSNDPAVVEAAQSRLGTMRSEQEALLRAVAAQVVDPRTNEINLNVLQRLTNPNNRSGFAQAFQRFPGLLQDLQNAETAQRLLLDVTDANSLAMREHDAQKWFSSLVDGDVANSISLAIGSPNNRPDNAASQLRGLLRVARQAGNEEFVDLAQRGLLDAILDRATVYAGGADGQVDFAAMRDFLFEPLSKGQPNTAMILRDGGILGERQLADLNTLLRQGETISRALARSQTDQELADALTEVRPLTLALVGRFLGAREGARIQRAMGMNTIQIPGMFANLGAQSMARVPTTKLQDVLVRFLDDPEFAETILSRAAEITERRPARARNLMTRIIGDLDNSLRRNGLIIGSGAATQEVTGEDLELPSPLPAAASAQPVPAQPAPAPAPVAPPPTPQPAPLQQGALPPAAPPLSAPQAGGQSRASYSALFPNDPISPMVQQREMQQGIGSLMGGR